ncbi:hypothetical protein F7D09_1513 [Bifidobacterium leontopitheci]|uniref:Uncharacterized protein n=1 Tax=Bifidobacterium leontopitheci TaxID=2650774 RepID=A0A6I1GE96_9BIFI|nr:hypothetical protein F7D09_1513 [Bifidobacterium leontopitheci]
MAKRPGHAARWGSSPRMRGTRVYRPCGETPRGIIPAYAGNTRVSHLIRLDDRDHPRVCGEHEVTGANVTRKPGSSPRMRGTLPRTQRFDQLRGIIPAYAGNTVSMPCTVLPCGDHPRVCGEHRNRHWPITLRRGSSPRMRGTRYIGRVGWVPRGIIPAYAGNTHRMRPVDTIGGDHPRVCGEHLFAELTAREWTGSSPRMRGTLRQVRIPEVRLGIIPAYAGNTRSRYPAGYGYRDHPRVCGEHRETVLLAAGRQGSSPRMRGTPQLVDDADRRQGIIPAYAGNTLLLWHRQPLTRDHPRVCGEHVLSAIKGVFDTGSSPRMRGTQNLISHASHNVGIIPAYAGNTIQGAFQALGWGDHPRVCGEHKAGVAGRRPCWGSSPRMRGTRREVELRTLDLGIIPAYAGNTSSMRHSGPRPWDHPRVCGEHDVVDDPFGAVAGSSPRMRGTLKSMPRYQLTAGIIPAYAGNTRYPRDRATRYRDHPRVCGEHHVTRGKRRESRGSSPRMRGTLRTGAR